MVSGVAGRERIPVTLLTGFLGSGKTTLANRFLRRPSFANTAVIVNELREIGLDHLLVERGDDSVLLLDSGCLCCALRGGLRETLADLFVRRAAGSVPRLRARRGRDDRYCRSRTDRERARAGCAVAHRVSPRRDSHDSRCAARGASPRGRARGLRQVVLADVLIVTKTDLAAPEAGGGARHAPRGAEPDCTKGDRSAR